MTTNGAVKSAKCTIVSILKKQPLWILYTGRDIQMSLSQHTKSVTFRLLDYHLSKLSMDASRQFPIVSYLQLAPLVPALQKQACASFLTSCSVYKLSSLPPYQPLLLVSQKFEIQTGLISPPFSLSEMLLFYHHCTRGRSHKLSNTWLGPYCVIHHRFNEY